MEGWEEVGEDIGAYVPISKILEHEGGKHDPEAVTATRRYIEKAFKMDERQMDRVGRYDRANR
eukprot:9158731-Lingulodinium_polyedra.AAC.1